MHTHPHFTMNHQWFYPKDLIILPSSLYLQPPFLSLHPSTFCFVHPIVLARSTSRQVLCIALPRAAKLMVYSILCDHAVFTFTHPEAEEEVGRAAEEEKYSNDDDEEEEEVKQHDEKHEDVKKEEAEEQRKCRARRVYLGHLCLHPHWPPPLAASPPPFLSLNPPSPHIVYPLASAGYLFQSTSAGLDANGWPWKFKYLEWLNNLIITS